MSTDTLVIPADNRILYVGRDREVFGFLSHFHPAPVVLDREVWPTMEIREALRATPCKGSGPV